MKLCMDRSGILKWRLELAEVQKEGKKCACTAHQDHTGDVPGTPMYRIAQTHLIGEIPYIHAAITNKNLATLVLKKWLTVSIKILNFDYNYSTSIA